MFGRIVLIWFCVLGAVAGEAFFKETDLFVAGTEGYHTFRIPAVVVATNRAILAFCEGRKDGRGDSGRIDLVLKRSIDGGETWGKLQVVREDAANVCGNPTPVVDWTAGKILLLSTWNLGSDTEKAILTGTSADTRRVFVQESSDNGTTWSVPREITASVKRPEWRWYATGPCNGIQLTRGTHPGRLLIPANHSEHTDPVKHPYRSHVFFSEDHGATWKLGGVEEEKTNESTLVELADGTVLQNMRSYHGENARAVARSTDGGESWSAVSLDKTLLDPVCQGSLLRYSWEPSRILFSNCASQKRENLTIRLSSDECKTWPAAKTLHSGPSAYSCLGILPANPGKDGDTILCLYEKGEKSPYEKIVIARMNLEKLLEGAQTPQARP
jgi:sialidase-1